MDRIAFIVGENFIFWSPIILALAALAACCCFVGFYLSRSGNGIGAFLAVPVAFVLSMFLSRLVHWYCRTDSYSSFEVAVGDFTIGGYALVGVFAGCILTACLLRLVRITKDLPEMLDCMSLAGALGMTVGRLASLFNSSDRGDVISEAVGLPWVYPVVNSVTGELEYRLATFMLQSIVSGVIFLLLVVFWLLMKKRGRSGDTCLLFLLAHGAAQILFDSTRYDALYLRSNGFVSMVQIAGAVAVVFAIVMFSVRLVRCRKWSPMYLVFWMPILILLGVAGYMEYYVQRHGDQAAFAYGMMGVSLLGVVLLGVELYTMAIIGENKKRALQKKEAAKV